MIYICQYILIQNCSIVFFLWRLLSERARTKFNGPVAAQYYEIGILQFLLMNIWSLKCLYIQNIHFLMINLYGQQANHNKFVLIF